MMRSSKSKSIKLLHLQAVLGGTVTVPTLTGNVTVKVCILYFIRSFKFLLVQDGSVHVLMICLVCHIICPGSPRYPARREGRPPGQRLVTGVTIKPF
jgi:hypothetical protein